MNTGLPAPRVPLNVTVEFRRNYARNSDHGLLKNISTTGAFIEMNQNHLHMNEKIKVTFMVSGRIRQVNASVVWARQNGVGVRFQPFNNQDMQIVDDLIYFIESQRNSRRNVLDTIFEVVTSEDREN